MRLGTIHPCWELARELYDRLALVRDLSSASLVIVVAQVVGSGAVLGGLPLLRRRLADSYQVTTICLVEVLLGTLIFTGAVAGLGLADHDCGLGGATTSIDQLLR